MEIQALGSLVVTDAGRPVPVGGHRQRSVLAGLVISDGEAVSTDRLIDIVWGDDPPPTARKSLQTYVSRLRRLLGEAVIVATPDGYRLNLSRDRIDVHRFEDLVEEGRRRLPGDAASAIETFDAALALWRGAPMSDIDAYGDLGSYVERLREIRLAAIEDRTEAALRLGRHGELVGELQRLVDSHPLRERLWEYLMLALYRSGRQAEALRAFQRFRTILAEELGIGPSASLQRLEERILQQDPALALGPMAPDRPAPPARNPYKGLRPFSEMDAVDFFGREALADRLVAAIRGGERFTALVGPSGSGKSSLARAGVIPAIRSLPGGPAWQVAVMTPGTHPFTQLEAALARLGNDGHTVVLDPGDSLDLLRTVLTIVPDDRTEVLLVIDQFEELLTGAIDEETVTSFVRQLVEAIDDPHGRFSVVITLRSDFFDQALRQADLAQLLATGAVNVPPLSPVELQAAVVRPAEAVGIEVEPELLAELVAETAHHPGSLPLLQFVLTELTDRADEGVLTLADLHAGGGIRGTLAQRSEELYARLSSAEQGAVRRLFLHLVTLNEGGEPTRRMVAIDDIGVRNVPDETLRRALEALVEGRLLSLGREAPGGRPTVEVAHEAVFREWPRCARWIDDARTEIRLGTAVERAAREWVAADRSSDYLVTGSRLQMFEDWAQATELGVSSLTAAFLDASLERRREQESIEAARTERERTLERRSVGRLRAVVAVLGVLAVVTTTLSIFAAGRSREAERQRQVVLSAATEILVRQLSNTALAQVGRDPELSLLLSLHAVQAATIRGDVIPRETIEALHWGLQEMGTQYPVGDGDVFVLSGPGGARGAYALPLGELVGLAEDAVSRDLTSDECRRFFSSGECPTLTERLSDAPLQGEALPSGGSELLEGTTVRVATPSFDSDLSGYRAEFDAFARSTGIHVVPREISDLERLMTSGRLEGEIDMVFVPQPGFIQLEGAASKLMDLGRFLPRDQLISDYGPYLVSWSTTGEGATEGAGPLLALPLNAQVKSLIWYSPRRFAEAGYTIPSTWQEMIALSDRIVADDGTPWCFAEESDDATGWPATDWVEDILLHEEGAEVYDGWVAGDIPFQDPRVRGAFERLGELFFHDGYVHGGRARALGMSFSGGAVPLLDDPPGCWMYHQASFAVNYFPPGIEPGEQVSAFPTPQIGDRDGEPLLIAGSFALVYHDRPEIREVVRYLASPDYGRELAGATPSVILSNRRFDVSMYPEEWRRTVGLAYGRAQEEGRIRFDGSDAMPPSVGQGLFWSSMVEYLREGPDSLDGILAELDAAMEEARR